MRKTGLKIDDARLAGLNIWICAGPPKCKITDAVCSWCYQVSPDDGRSTEEIMADMKIKNKQ